MTPIGYCDADWAGCKHSRKPTSGYVFSASGAFFYSFEMHSTGTASTTEAKLLTLRTAALEGLWIGSVFAFAVEIETYPQNVSLTDTKMV